MELNRHNYIELPIDKLGRSFKIAPNFALGEIASKCGDNIVRLHPYSPIMLQAIRDRFKAPITVNSGYRTPKHNKSDNVRGAPNSTHIYGMGFDLTAPQLDKLEQAVRFVKLNGLAWIGGWKRYNTFIHVDCWKNRTW